ncbi:MAG: haloacid dehalogenase-like hydrolase [Blautia sp.]|nr:haloacid dehalogenase-like hydrolase [Blautia sp.]
MKKLPIFLMTALLALAPAGSCLAEGADTAAVNETAEELTSGEAAVFTDTGEAAVFTDTGEAAVFTDTGEAAVFTDTGEAAVFTETGETATGAETEGTPETAAAEETSAEAGAAQTTQTEEEAEASEPITEENPEFEEVFADWNEDAPSLNALIEYVESVTDEDSADYIPPEDRIAVFDMDGTVYGELFPTYLEYHMLAWRILKDPSIEPDEEMLAVGRTLRDCALDNSFPEDMPIQHAIQAARAYAGMTINEFYDFVTEILLRDVDGFEGMTYGEAFYQPVIEVVDFLNDFDFKVYLCSGSDRFICRALLEGMLDIPAENIIGMDVAVEATNQNGEDGLNYVFTAGDDVLRTDRLLIKNLKMNKVAQIVQEIGHQPVLSFGNSSGDVSMHTYTISNNRYKSAAFMLVADDDVRDYGNPEKAQGLREKWEASGYHVISMKDDFRTIYGDDVVKTGSFHWAEELADDRGEIRDSAETEGTAETAAEDEITSGAEAPVESEVTDGVAEPAVPGGTAVEEEAADTTDNINTVPADETSVAETAAASAVEAADAAEVAETADAAEVVETAETAGSSENAGPAEETVPRKRVLRSRTEKQLETKSGN